MIFSSIFHIAFIVFLLAFAFVYKRGWHMIDAALRGQTLTTESIKSFDTLENRSAMVGVFALAMAVVQCFHSGFAWLIGDFFFWFVLLLLFLSSFLSMSVYFLKNSGVQRTLQYLTRITLAASLYAVVRIFFAVVIGWFTFTMTSLVVTGSMPNYDNGPYGGHSSAWYGAHENRLIIEGKWCESHPSAMQSLSCDAVHRAAVAKERAYFDGQDGNQ